LGAEGSGFVKLFVYGTLRSRAPMHGLLAGEVDSLGPARVCARLLDLGAFPGLVAALAADEWVHGELYRIHPGLADEVLERLDRYEGDFFVRAEEITVDESGSEVRALLYRYVGDTSGARHVVAGDWLAHLDELGVALNRES
jgi:gamma-glutamylcyclotransferase (GGCT)/AIG2-like uncharacterized protein YtfP